MVPARYAQNGLDAIQTDTLLSDPPGTLQFVAFRTSGVQRTALRRNEGSSPLFRNRRPTKETLGFVGQNAVLVGATPAGVSCKTDPAALFDLGMRVQHMGRPARPWFRRSVGQWYITFMGNQIPLGVTDPEARDAALAAFAAFLDAQQKPPQPPNRPAAPIPDTPPSPTVAEAVASYLASDSVAAFALSTIRPVTRLARLLATRWGAERIDTIDLEAVKRDARTYGWSDDYRRNYLATVETIFKHAGRVIDLGKPPRGSAGAEIIIDEETHRLALQAARGIPDLPPLLECLRHSGARPAEIHTLTVAAVNWQSATASLKHHKTAGKTKKPKLLVFTKAAMAILEKQRAKYGEGRLFRNGNGGPWSCGSLTRAVWRVSKTIGRPYRCYGQRHTFATNLLLAGVPETHVAALLGHSDTKMVNSHYSHVGSMSNVLRDAAEKANRIAG
jgi:integrase